MLVSPKRRLTDRQKFVLRRSGIRGEICGSWIRGGGIRGGGISSAACKEREDAAAEFLRFKTVGGGVESARDDPELFGAARSGVNHFGMAAGKRDVFFIANEEHGKWACCPSFHRRNFRDGKAGKFFSAIQQCPAKRRKQSLAEQRIFSEAGVIVRGFTHVGEGCFGDDGFDARIGGRGLQDDSRAHGFAEGEDMLEPWARGAEPGPLVRRRETRTQR